jgi:hypothetical protein
MTEQEKLYHKKIIFEDFKIPVFLPIDEGLSGINKVLRDKYDN